MPGRWEMVVVLASVSILVGIRTKRPVVIVLAILVIVGGRSHREAERLRHSDPSGSLAGVARIVTDPEAGAFDVQGIISVRGQRYVASVPLGQSYEFSTMLAGQSARIEGRVRRLDGAPEGWVLSNHLAGRIKLSSVRPDGTGGPWTRLANDLRRRVADSANAMSSDERALYLGLVVGDDRLQSELQAYRFKASGLSHLLAVSGQNIAFVVMLAAPFTRRLSPRASLLVIIPILALFTVMTRAEPSVLRAVVMALIALIATTASRRAAGIRVLALTVMLLLLIDPLVAHSIGFQLSVVATLGLIVISEPLARRLPGPSWFSEPLAMTLAAQVATSPIIMGFNPSIAAVGPLANLLTVPLAGWVMMIGLTGGIVVGSLHPMIGVVTMYPIRWVLRWIDSVAAVASRVPLAPLTPTKLSIVVGVIIGAVVLCDRGIVLGRNQRRILCIATMAVVVVVLIPSRIPPGVHPLSEGAVLWRSPCGENVVAASRNTKGVDLLVALRELNVTSVEAVVTDGSASASSAAAFVDHQYGRPQRHVGSGSTDDLVRRMESLVGSC